MNVYLVRSTFYVIESFCKIYKRSFLLQIACEIVLQ